MRRSGFTADYLPCQVPCRGDKWKGCFRIAKDIARCRMNNTPRNTFCNVIAELQDASGQTV